jgi:hypothetical protein
VPDTNTLPDLLASYPGLAERVRVVLSDASAGACRLIGSRLAAVQALAQVVVARQSLDGTEAEAVIRRSLDAGRHIHAGILVDAEGGEGPCVPLVASMRRPRADVGSVVDPANAAADKTTTFPASA